MSASDSLFASHSVVNLITSNVLQHGFAILSNFIIFTMVFKFVHNGRVQWKLAMGGALVTAIMLYIGQLLIKYYLFHFFFAASIGITGSFFVILAWVYYSSQIIFFGAKFTAEYARRINRPIQFKD
jgi:membrane protein